MRKTLSEDIWVQDLAKYLNIYRCTKDQQKEKKEIMDYLIQKCGLVPDTARKNVARTLSDPGIFMTVCGDGIVTDGKAIAECLRSLEHDFATGPDEGEARLAELENAVRAKEEQIAALKKENEILKEAEGILKPHILLLDTAEIRHADGSKVFVPDEDMMQLFTRLDPDMKECCRQTWIAGVNADALNFTADNSTKQRFTKLLPDNVLKSRIKDVRSLKEFLLERHTKREKEEEFEKAEERRKRMVKRILDNDHLSNQDKLSLYAFYSGYRGTEEERILAAAGNCCANANLIIELLEEPDLNGSYSGLIDFIRQSGRQNQYQIRLEFARELLKGRWYITAEYDGKPVKFQLMPVEDIERLYEITGIRRPTLDDTRLFYEGQPVEKKKEPNAIPETAADVLEMDDGILNYGEVQ